MNTTVAELKLYDSGVSSETIEAIRYRLSEDTKYDLSISFKTEMEKDGVLVLIIRFGMN